MLIGALADEEDHLRVADEAPPRPHAVQEVAEALPPSSRRAGLSSKTPASLTQSSTSSCRASVASR